MMALPGGMERTREEYAGLASNLRLRLKRIVETMSPLLFSFGNGRRLKRITSPKSQRVAGLAPSFNSFGAACLAGGQRV